MKTPVPCIPHVEAGHGVECEFWDKNETVSSHQVAEKTNFVSFKHPACLSKDRTASQPLSREDRWKLLLCLPLSTWRYPRAAFHLTHHSSPNNHQHQAPCPNADRNTTTDLLAPFVPYARLFMQRSHSVTTRSLAYIPARASWEFFSGTAAGGRPYGVKGGKHHMVMGNVYCRVAG